MTATEVLQFLESRKGWIIHLREATGKRKGKAEIYDGTRGGITSATDEIEIGVFESLKNQGFIAVPDDTPGTNSETSKRYTITVTGLAHLKTLA
jgi:hypothetical protein